MRALLIAALAVCTLPVAYLVNSMVPDVYMDEIFHVRQAQHYCRWDFEAWDPMITTFPGLYVFVLEICSLSAKNEFSALSARYLISLVYELFIFPWIRLMMPVSSLGELCTPASLRSVNILLSFICVLLFRSILLELDPRKRARAASIKSLVLALYPLHWFFTFLYYTDIGSTAAVMAMYLACLKKSYWVSALFATVAIMFRQTNAVWTAFVLCIGVIQFLQDSRLCIDEDQNRAHPIDNINGEHLRRRRNRIQTGRADSAKKLKKFTGIWSEVWSIIQEAWFRRWEALRNFFPLLVVILAFIMFILFNGSIVVGAKEAHKVSPHFAQLLYFGLFSAGVLVPFHFVTEKLLVLQNVFRRMPLLASSLALAIVMVSLLVVHCFSLAHPYLLADNRHYPFYIWKDVIQAHWTVKYLLVPLYVYSWWSIIYSLLEKSPNSTAILDQRRKILQFLWTGAFLGAVVAVLVPAPLIEFRYFTVPFYILALRTLSGIHVSSWKLLLIAVEFVAVNIFTMGLFLFKSFTWAHEEGRQRFIW